MPPKNNIEFVTPVDSTGAQLGTSGNPLYTNNSPSDGTPITGQALESGGSGILGWLSSVRRAITNLAALLNVSGPGFLRARIEPRQLFYDPFDGVVVDTTVRWASSSGNSGVAASQTGGTLSMGTGTVANGWSKLVSQPSLTPTIPGWLVFSDAIQLPDGAAPTANAYRFWGCGTTPGTPSTGTPVTDGYGFELGTDGKLRAVVFAGGSKSVIADLSSGSGTGVQPTNNTPHRYIIEVRTDVTFFYIDGINSASLVASTSFQSPQQQTLPKLFLCIGAATPPVSNTQIQCLGAAISDTAQNTTKISDGTYAWRTLAIDASGRITIANLPAALGTQALAGSLAINESSATLYAGTFSTSGSAAAIASSQAVREVIVQNDPDNTADILVGNSSAQTIQLKPGWSIVIPVTDIATVYAKSVSGTPTGNYLGRS